MTSIGHFDASNDQDQEVFWENMVIEAFEASEVIEAGKSLLSQPGS